MTTIYKSPVDGKLYVIGYQLGRKQIDGVLDLPKIGSQSVIQLPRSELRAIVMEILADLITADPEHSDR